jgi:polyvinyl alcohol dehydrogenase (cytochrome)
LGTERDGFVFGGTTGGAMVALDAATGAALWTFQITAPIEMGPAVAKAAVYWGLGARPGVAGNTLYAFGLSN